MRLLKTKEENRLIRYQHWDVVKAQKHVDLRAKITVVNSAVYTDTEYGKQCAVSESLLTPAGRESEPLGHPVDVSPGSRMRSIQAHARHGTYVAIEHWSEEGHSVSIKHVVANSNET